MAGIGKVVSQCFYVAAVAVVVEVYCGEAIIAQYMPVASFAGARLRALLLHSRFTRLYFFFTLNLITFIGKTRTRLP